METVHISQFYTCSSIKIPCELYYICELSKYLYLNHNKVLSLDGVIISADIEKTGYFNYFKYIVSQGYIVNHNLKDTDYDADVNNIINVLFTTEKVPYDAKDNAKRKESFEYKFKNPQLKQVIFSEQQPQEWLWCLDNKSTSINGANMSDNLSRQIWLSLIAFVAVERLITKQPNKLRIIIASQLIIDKSTLSYILLLQNKSTCFDGWLVLEYEKTITNNMKAQLGYVAWYYSGLDFGYHLTEVNQVDKYNEAKKANIEVGDLVFYYKRNYEQNYNYIKSIESCKLAKVVAMTRFGLTLECINTCMTYYHGKLEFDNNTTIVKKMYANNKPYEKLNTSIVTTDWVNCGVNHVFYDELEFITTIDEADDLVVSAIPINGTSYKYRYIRMPQNDLIYWILEDYNYTYNKDKFLEQNFSKREPLKKYYDEHLDVPELFYFSKPLG